MSPKKVKKETEEDRMAKLVRLTKLMKEKKVVVSKEKQTFAAPTTNKWRSSNPKFAEPAKPSPTAVDAGGLKVDPSLKDEYDAWRKEKEEQMKFESEMRKKRNQNNFKF